MDRSDRCHHPTCNSARSLLPRAVDCRIYVAADPDRVNLRDARKAYEVSHARSSRDVLKVIATATVFVAAPAWAQAPTVDGKVYTTGDVTSEVSIHYSDFAGRPAISPPLDEAGNSVRAQNAR